MLIYFEKTLKKIISLNRYIKKIIAIIIDITLCIFCIWLAFWLRLEEIVPFKDISFNLILISIVLSIPIFWWFGLYRTIFRFSGFALIFVVSKSILLYGLIFFLIVGIYVLPQVPRSIGVIQPMLFYFALIGFRFFVKYLLMNNQNLTKKLSKKKNVLIYGAGDAGRQLLSALENSNELKVVGLIDDNKQLHKQIMLGKIIFAPSKLENLIKTNNIKMILLAIPSINRSKRNQIIQNLNKHKLIIKTLPSIQEFVDDKITLSDIRDLDINDLLNRDSVSPRSELMFKNIKSKIVLVTGAGGSIGSELCRQVVRLNPKKLLLLEQNEFVLYKIYEELKLYKKNFEIVPLLANIQDETRLNEIFKTFNVETIYHSAAYKHVPLVEENICEGVNNNVYGTLSLAKAAVNNNVSNVVFISSDKAVRPTNIMGATKRLAELCMQGIYETIKKKNTIFAIVRFGNVLESSGSVIPKFKKQIKQGGPVTLTDNNVTRYFMTITEAAQLVIQAGAMSKNCEVFILDMGKSIKIKDLIHKMIKLSGLSIKDNSNLDGDIEIKVIGLRPGEKLYEELLIGDNPQKTDHEKIKKAQDPQIPFSQLEFELIDLKKSVLKNDVIEVKKILEKIVKSYKSNTKIIDHIHVRKLGPKN
jgi:FlaA1/EpsC-like NDP-sugar epimerase